MEKIDYSDINKFFVSVGIVLIGLAVMIPYFYLKSDFGLYIEAEKFEAFRQPVKDIVVFKENAVIVFQKIVLWVSGAFFVLGTVSLVTGLVRWRKRQDKIYERFDKELHKLDLEIVALTPEEKKEKAELEVRKIVKAERKRPGRGEEPAVADMAAYIERYMEAERKLTDSFMRTAAADYEVLPQQKLDSRFRVDLLLRARYGGVADRIVEFKYFGGYLSPKMSRDTVGQLNSTMAYYNERSGRKAVPVLLVVYDGSFVVPGRIRRFEERLYAETCGLPDLAGLRTAFVEQSEIERFDAEEVL